MKPSRSSVPALSLKPLIIPVFIPHQGCPHACVFCNQRAITGASPALPDKTEIHDRVDQFLGYARKDRSFTEISFFGGNFLGLLPDQIQSLLEAAAELVRVGKIDGIRFSTRPDTIDENRLRLLAPYPVSTVEIGVQSMNDKVLREAGRGHTAEDSAKAVAFLRKTRAAVGLQFMTGLPGDTDAICLATARRIIALKPDFVRIYPTLVLRGSRLGQWYREGRYQPLALGDCVTQLKTLYRMFTENQIPVIRMGLQASKELDDPATVLAGPYHPALGHLVLSEILLDKAVEAIRKLSRTGDGVCLTVHPKSLSRLQGLHKKNIHRLQRMFGLSRLDIRTDPGLSPDVVTAA